MKRKRNGFTLVELMVVITIMAILAAASAPVFSGYVKKAKATAHLAECRMIYMSVQTSLEELRTESSDGKLRVKDIDMDRLIDETKALSGIKDIGEGSDAPGSGKLTETYTVYVSDRADGPVCTAVVYTGEDAGVWIFDTENGTYREAD